MELDVNEANEAALALYEAFGFRAGSGDGAPRDLYMRRHLDAGPDA
jgi:ribosomal protein S18 acetylase RimI-like enzyme